MTGAPILPTSHDANGYVVRAPRSTDALGHALRGAFGSTPPADFASLLIQLDRIAIH